MSLQRAWRTRTAGVAIATALVVAACSGGARPELTDVAAPGPDPTPTAAPVEVEATPTAEPVDPLEVVTVTAAPDAGDPIASEPEFRNIPVFDSPDGQPMPLGEFVLNPTYFGSELTMMVVEGRPGDEWVKVQVPVRPNGTEGWVNTAQFEFDTHRFRAKVDLSDFAVEVYEGEDLIAATDAVIGRDDAPTPVGRYYVNDKVAGDGGVYGSWILSLSAFSETLEVFQGGIPVIAIHGTSSPQDVGQALSSGCVRVPNDVIELLAAELPLGTPVDIVV